MGSRKSINFDLFDQKAVVSCLWSFGSGSMMSVRSMSFPSQDRLEMFDVYKKTRSSSPSQRPSACDFGLQDRTTNENRQKLKLWCVRQYPCAESSDCSGTHRKDPPLLDVLSTIMHKQSLSLQEPSFVCTSNIFKSYFYNLLLSISFFVFSSNHTLKHFLFLSAYINQSSVDIIF